MPAPKSPTFLAKIFNPGRNDEEFIHSSYNAAKVIETLHERIHVGKAWYFSGHDLHVAGTNRFALIMVGDTEFHLRDFGVKTNQGPYSGTLYEAPVIDVNSLGAEIPMKNLNRNSTFVSSTAFYSNPVIDTNSLGTYLDHGHIFESAGGAIKSIAGEISTIVTEWELKKNTNYVAWFTNSSTNDAEFVQHILGYEAE